MCCCILVCGCYWSRNGRNNVLFGLPDLAKENFENRDKSKITKHLIFPIRYCRRETIYILFYKFDNSKLISKLVSSDKSVFLCFYATQL